MLNLLIIFLFTAPNVWSYSSKKLHLVHADNPYTLYCQCKYQKKNVDIESCGYIPHKDKKKAQRLEWEHVVPAHAFGHSFPEWREGGPKCKKKGKKYKGRRCARKNRLFRKMEDDLYNIYPEIGELNNLRQNYSMTEFGKKNKLSGLISFGNCQAKIHERKFEPMDGAKGIVARIYMYMDATYPGRGIISDKNRKLFEAWDKTYPVTEGECKRAKRIEALQGNPNPVLEKACKLKDFSYQKRF